MLPQTKPSRALRGAGSSHKTRDCAERLGVAEPEDATIFPALREWLTPPERASLIAEMCARRSPTRPFDGPISMKEG